MEKKLKEDNFTLKKKLVNEVWGTHGGCGAQKGISMLGTKVTLL